MSVNIGHMVGITLRLIRDVYGISPTTISTLVGQCQPTLIKLEYAKSEPKNSTVAAQIQHIYGLSLIDFWQIYTQLVKELGHLADIRPTGTRAGYIALRAHVMSESGVPITRNYIQTFIKR